MLMLTQLALLNSCCCFLFATISFLFHGFSFYHLLPSPWRWRKGFSFHFFYSPCFFFWIPLQLRCKPPDLKKQELAKRYSKRADATEDLQEAMEVFFFGQTWSDK
ncbi:uncharacterized protein LOC105785429 isoform X1 [Gossypium raimondii]|uniref:Uncharacterized protein n=1 Tax=Gossypium raimondii TaxID=29730 RepID=A0A0D2R6S1_GOSRA|nr:uncharacterized protein LOC105785429 isoform X1 [Gossypium raimondii]KJB15010.1 hypothetical protein B456_002G154800 [Gossypium raimondii]KJB15012.1 hypothetical protein B456_002G154800 [Gossypium raimondii]